MKHTFLFFCLLFSSWLFGQNLVPNPSFEEYTDCPDDHSQISHLIGCTSFNGSPDAFNTCSQNDLSGVPSNVVGYQYPLDGEGYAGFIGLSYNNDREVIGVELIESLEVGENYFITMNIVRAFGGPFHQNCDCANSHLGARLFTYSFLGDGIDDAPVDNFAHLKTEQVVSDSVNWTTISGWVQADSAYTYLALGVFHDLENVAIENYNQEDFLNTYYYIDGVCLSKDPADCEQFTEVNEITGTPNIQVFPNPTKDILSVIFSSSMEKIVILDSTGRLAFQSTSIDASEYQIDLAGMAHGVYVLLVMDRNGRVQTTRFIKS